MLPLVLPLCTPENRLALAALRCSCRYLHTALRSFWVFSSPGWRNQTLSDSPPLSCALHPVLKACFHRSVVSVSPLLFNFSTSGEPRSGPSTLPHWSRIQGRITSQPAGCALSHTALEAVVFCCKVGLLACAELVNNTFRAWLPFSQLFYNLSFCMELWHPRCRTSHSPFLRFMKPTAHQVHLEQQPSSSFNWNNLFLNFTLTF